MKQIKIDEELFFDLVKYFFANSLQKETAIKEKLYTKLDKMVAREHYKEYLYASPEIKKEMLKNYLKCKSDK